MRATLHLSEKDIANAVMHWLDHSGIKADADSFTFSITRGDRDWEPDVVSGNIMVEVGVK